MSRLSCLNKVTTSSKHCTECFYLFQLILQHISVDQKAIEVMRCKHNHVQELKKSTYSPSTGYSKEQSVLEPEWPIY